MYQNDAGGVPDFGERGGDGILPAGAALHYICRRRLPRADFGRQLADAPGAPARRRYDDGIHRIRACERAQAPKQNGNPPDGREQLVDAVHPPALSGG